MPMNRSLYPKDWPEIAARMKQEAGYKCQECGAEAGSVVCFHRTDKKRFVGIEDEAELYWHGEEYEDEAVLIQLGVAHLDQNPANNDPSNLRVLCRGCHLRYDAPFHAVKARKTKLKKKHQAILMTGQLLMFKEPE
jgi:5-methylcytosine-specific restriction endonuclease McrA